jgi:hypothetical protein
MVARQCPFCCPMSLRSQRKASERWTMPARLARGGFGGPEFIDQKASCLGHLMMRKVDIISLHPNEWPPSSDRFRYPDDGIVAVLGRL